MLRRHRNTLGNGETVSIITKQTPTSSGYGTVENNILENERTQTNQKHLLMKHRVYSQTNLKSKAKAVRPHSLSVIIWPRGQSRSPKKSKQWLPWHFWPFAV